LDKEHIKGAAKKAEGSVKEAAGKMAGDKSLEMKGEADKAEGNIRNAAGDVKDAFQKK
jgi:uncharacterized protein YjbJ (UPF0337 family)